MKFLPGRPHASPSEPLWFGMDEPRQSTKPHGDHINSGGRRHGHRLSGDENEKVKNPSAFTHLAPPIDDHTLQRASREFLKGWRVKLQYDRSDSSAMSQWLAKKFAPARISTIVIKEPRFLFGVRAPPHSAAWRLATTSAPGESRASARRERRCAPPSQFASRSR